MRRADSMSRNMYQKHFPNRARKQAAYDPEDNRFLTVAARPGTHASRARFQTPSEVARDDMSGLVSWLLLFMGVSTLTPCILLPEWRTYQSLNIARQEQQHRLARMEQQVERERRLLDAVRSDPAVLARLARRELGFKSPGEQPVMVAVDPILLSTHDAFTPTPPALPPMLASLASRLPDFDYDAIFCHEQTRLILLTMSIGLIAVAMAMPGRSSGKPRA